MHETAELGHVFLPAAAFAEKDGTFTNSERRVQRVRAAVPPPGEARPDWWITAELAKRVARRIGLDADRQFDYGSASQIFDEMARLIPFMGGLSHERLDREGGLQWPCPTADHPGTPYLYADSFPRGLGRFVPAVQTAAAAELPDPDYPFVLHTGRPPHHLPGGTMPPPRRGAARAGPAPRGGSCILRMQRCLGVETGDPIRGLVATRRSRRLRAPHRGGAPGAIFVPFVKLADSAANFLTNSAHDPSLEDPLNTRSARVRIEAIRAP
jgi:predicted molibdopterin-dependent oxidoreductase YjgC